jgi:uncharacterized protein (TIGR04255 family)
MSVEITTEDQFPHLDKAPITEAIIEVRARAEAPWTETEIRPELLRQLPDYPHESSERNLSPPQAFTTSEGGVLAATPKIDLSWKGLRFRSHDQKQIASFFRDLFAFSRLAPYNDWQAFSTEGLRLLGLYAKVARPSTVQRLGLRFINRINIPKNGRLEEYLTAPPKEVSGLRLPLMGFFHVDNLIVPGYTYAINFARTLQISSAPLDAKPALILDLDVYTLQSFAMDVDAIREHLEKMRWLKNKVFFANITKELLQELR